MRPLGNDRWLAEFTPEAIGRYEYSITAWIDEFETWRRDTTKKRAAGVDTEIDRTIGAKLIEAAVQRADRHDGPLIEAAAAALQAGELDSTLSSGPLQTAMRSWGARSGEVTYARQLPVEVERPLARFSAWYELFPRSCSGDVDRHGTLDDCRERLGYIAGLGFDMLYLPPIHPIGMTHRKGPNNTLMCRRRRPGQPLGDRERARAGTTRSIPSWARSRTRALVGAARQRGIEVALDIAFQCSPDHP